MEGFIDFVLCYLCPAAAIIGVVLCIWSRVLLRKLKRIYEERIKSLEEDVHHHEDDTIRAIDECTLLKVQHNDLVKENEELNRCIKARRDEHAKLCKEYNHALARTFEAIDELEAINRKDTHVSLAKEALYDIPEVKQRKNV